MKISGKNLPSSRLFWVGLWTMAGCSILLSFLAAVHLTRLQLVDHSFLSQETYKPIHYEFADLNRVEWMKREWFWDILSGWFDQKKIMLVLGPWVPPQSRMRNCFWNHRRGQQWKNPTNGTGKHWKPFFCHLKMLRELDWDKKYAAGLTTLCCLLQVLARLDSVWSTCQPLRPRLLSTVSRLWEWRLSHQNQRDFDKQTMMLKYVECTFLTCKDSTGGNCFPMAKRCLVDSTLNRAISCYAASHSTGEDQTPGCFGEHVWRSATDPLSDILVMNNFKNIWRSSTHACVELHFRPMPTLCLQSQLHTRQKDLKKTDSLWHLRFS